MTEHYVLRVGDDDEARLALSDRIYGGASRAFIRQLGPLSGRRVLDVGCGSGNLACWLGREVGAGGSVIGVDASDEQIGVARRNAQKRELRNVEFVRADATELDRLPSNFDLVYCRFVLIHLREPVRALRQMWNRVRSEGVLACEEPTTSLHFAFPANELFARANELTMLLGDAAGCDYNLGAKLPGVFLDAGLPWPSMSFFQPAIVDPELKSIFPRSFAQVRNAVVSRGLATAEEADEIHAELAAAAAGRAVLFGGLRNSQAWVRKPTLPQQGLR